LSLNYNTTRSFQIMSILWNITIYSFCSAYERKIELIVISILFLPDLHRKSARWKLRAIYIVVSAAY